MKRENQLSTPIGLTTPDGSEESATGYLAEHRLQLIMSAVLSARGECRTRQLAEQFQLSSPTVFTDEPNFVTDRPVKPV
jgi:hypothetical protein